MLNGNAYWDDDAGSNPADVTSPSGSVCEAKILDVKATEANSFPLASVLPLFPDLKRKARLQIEEAEGVTGLLPIAVRIPRPLSAVAVFYNEEDGTIISKQRMREVCIPSVAYCVPFAPAGLGQWTTDPASGAVPSVQVEGNHRCRDREQLPSVVQCAGCIGSVSQDQSVGRGWDGHHCVLQPELDGYLLGRDRWSRLADRRVGSAVHSRVQHRADGGQHRPALDTNRLPQGEWLRAIRQLPTDCRAPRSSTSRWIWGAREHVPRPARPSCWPVTRLPLRAEDVEVRFKARESRWDELLRLRHLVRAPPQPRRLRRRDVLDAGDLLPIPPDSRERRRDPDPAQGRGASERASRHCANTNYNNNCRWSTRPTRASAPRLASSQPTRRFSRAPIQRSFMGSIDRTGPCGGSGSTSIQRATPTRPTGCLDGTPHER